MIFFWMILAVLAAINITYYHATKDTDIWLFLISIVIGMIAWFLERHYPDLYMM